MIDILLVEDDKEICFILTELLKRNPYNVSAYHNGIEAIEALSSKKYDLMLLDLMLPDLPGEKILFHLKKHNNSIPVIVISAKNQPEIRINLLRSGADDYITKPFNPMELVARVNSQIRRYTKLGSINKKEENEDIYKSGELVIDDSKKEVTVDGKNIKLTPTEYNILKFLTKNKGKVFSISQIYENVWEEESYGAENIIAVHIRHIREKIEINPREPKYLKVIWGIGYKIENI